MTLLNRIIRGGTVKRCVLRVDIATELVVMSRCRGCATRSFEFFFCKVSLPLFNSWRLKVVRAR